MNHVEDITEISSTDNTPVSSRELLGWFSAGIAAEGYSALGSGFFPLILQGLSVKSDAAFEHSNHTLPCNTTGEYDCDILLGPSYINSSSLVLYANTISTLIQFFLFISLGSLADHGSNRKKFLMISGISGGMLGTCFFLLTSYSTWWFAYLLYITSNVILGPYWIFMQAYIPILVRYSSPVMNSQLEGKSRHEKHMIADRVSNDISSKGVYYAYITALVEVLVVGGSILPFILNPPGGSLPYTYPYQAAVGAVALFQVLVLIILTNPRLKVRPGPPLPPNTSYIFYSVNSVWKQLKEARRLSELFKFLVGWFMYSDAFSSLSNTAVLFAQSQLGAGNTVLLISAVVIPTAGALGSVFFNKLQKYMNLTTQRALMIQNFCYCFLPLYGLIGFIAPFGLTSQWELPYVAAFHGFLLGAAQATCRALFSELLPKGLESRFFSLYEITNHGSSWIGPLVAAALGNATGNLRYAFFFILLSMILPLFAFGSIDVPRGKEESILYTLEEAEYAKLKNGGIRSIGATVSVRESQRITPEVEDLESPDVLILS